MRAFAYYRNMLLENEELRKEIKKLDRKMNKGIKYALDRIEATNHFIEKTNWFQAIKKGIDIYLRNQATT